MKASRPNRAVAHTLPEVLVALILIGTFFASVFELNAVCLRYIEASKEAVAAIAAVQDRAEVLRNLAFSDLTSSSYVQNLLVSPANASTFANRQTEVVQLRAYPTANGISQFTRAPGGVVTVNSAATSLGSTLVRADITVTWSAILGGRSRTEQTTTIIASGQKK